MNLGGRTFDELRELAEQVALLVRTEPGERRAVLIVLRALVTVQGEAQQAVLARVDEILEPLIGRIDGKTDAGTETPTA